MSEDGDPAADVDEQVSDGTAETADRAEPSVDGGQVDGDQTDRDQADGDETAGETDEATVLTEQVEVDHLVDRAAEYDEELAEDVGAVAEVTRDLAETVDRLEAELADREAELAERDEEIEGLRSRLKRKQADFENYKKRRKREEQNIRERATEDLVERLLDVRDNLVRAVSDDQDDVEGLREGVKMTLNEFDRVLDAENVQEIDPQPGAEVDPGRHEVMMQVDSDQPEGTVAEVYQPGYEMADQVLRAAKVTVSDGSADGEGDDVAVDDA